MVKIVLFLSRLVAGCAPNVAVIQIWVDAGNRLVEVIENYEDGSYSEDAPDEDLRTTYAYDALGRRVVLTDAAAITTTYDYDALSRLRAVTYGGAVTATYAYDARGPRVAMTDTTGVTQYAYDALGRVTGLTHTVVQQVEYTLGYRYDRRGRRTALVYPDGAVISYTYDAAARLTAVVEDTTTYAAHEYDPAGRLLGATMANGTHTGYAYDAANRLTQISTTAVASGPMLAQFDYSYDPVVYFGNAKLTI